MPRETDAKERRRRYWLTWWLWPWLLLLGRDRPSDGSAIRNSLLAACWVGIGAWSMLTAAVFWQSVSQEQTPAKKVFLGLVFALGLIALVTGIAISFRQRRADLRGAQDTPDCAGRRWQGVRPHDWRHWLRVSCGPLALLSRRATTPEDYRQLRPWLYDQIAAGPAACGVVLLAVLLAVLFPYWGAAAGVVHQALAWLLGREADRSPELGLPALLIVFGVPVVLIAGLVWHLRHRARRRRDEAYLEQVEQRMHDGK